MKTRCSINVEASKNCSISVGSLYRFKKKKITIKLKTKKDTAMLKIAGLGDLNRHFTNGPATQTGLKNTRNLGEWEHLSNDGLETATLDIPFQSV